MENQVEKDLTRRLAIFFAYFFLLAPLWIGIIVLSTYQTLGALITIIGVSFGFIYLYWCVKKYDLRHQRGIKKESWDEGMKKALPEFRKLNGTLSKEP